jgi:RND family efflux transporter MFP subunit
MKNCFPLSYQPYRGAAGHVVLSLYLLLTGCKQPAPVQATAVAPSVIVTPVVKSGAGRELHLSGSLSAERSIALSFATLGVVQQVMVQEGQAVKRGQVLAVVERRGFEDALGIAEAKAKQAEDAYRRLLPIYNNKNLAEVKMVEVETGRQQARLAVSMARKNVEDTVLRAPVAAVVASRNVEPGASASPAAPAFTLVQTGTLMATAPIPETLVAKVQRGTPARVIVQALNTSAEGVVREIAVVANPLTRTYDIKVALPNPDGALRVGMIADIYLKVGDTEGDLVVPPEAVRVDENGAPYLFVVAPNKTLQRRQVRIVRFAGEDLALTGDIREGETVVISGTPMLAEGVAVRPIEQSTRRVIP